MKTFNEFIDMNLGYQFSSAEEAAELAASYGFSGFHEVDGIFYPCLTPMEFQRMLAHIRGKKLVGACESIQIDESVFRYTWDTVTAEDVASYVKKNGLKLVRDKNNKDLYAGMKNGKAVFKYDIDEMNLYSDHTIIQFEDGKVK